MSKHTWVVAVAAVTAALSLGVATAAAGGGNSANAKLCQNGWTTLVRADLTPFANQGACVSYAAHGGAFGQAKSQSQIDCEAAGGTFTPGPGNNTTGGTIWTCSGSPNLNGDFFFTLINDCANALAGTPGFFEDALWPGQASCVAVP